MTRVEPATRCPGCQRSELRELYTATDVPVHSCLLMPTREEALGFPTGDLNLKFCNRCGLIFNATFDASVHAYSSRYEETQGFSPTFSKYADELASELVERWGVRQKTVVEIGCGKGEFLANVCETGDNRGYGIDPAYVPSRMDDRHKRRLTFLREFYAPRHRHLPAHLIACRHTLEHIAQPGELLKEIRLHGQQLAHKPLLFFEVPDVLRQLEECAFWDLYYEHCNYFSAGSLARLFRTSGFEVEAVRRVYCDQYLLLWAREHGANGNGQPTTPGIDHDLDALRALVASFPQRMRAKRDEWSQRVEAAASKGHHIAIWGSGSKGVGFLTTLGLNEDAVGCVVDINPHKHGKFMPGTGQPIVAPTDLIGYRPDLVIVMNPVYIPEITRDLDRLGLRPEIIAV